jgi:hypothetical protein
LRGFSPYSFTSDGVFWVGAILVSFIIAAGVVYIPSMNALFGTPALSPLEFLLILLLSSTGFIYLEISKTLRSKRMGLMVK